MSNFKTVAQVGEIPEGEGRAFEYDDRLVAVFLENGQYRAIDDMCPHMGASLASGHLEDGAVACPWHGWRFDTRDGSWCDNRRLKIDAYDVRIEGNEIQIAPRPSLTEGNQASGSPLGAAPTPDRQVDTISPQDAANTEPTGSEDQLGTEDG